MAVRLRAPPYLHRVEAWARIDAEEARALSDFSVRVNAAGAVVTVVLAGELDLAEADGLWEQLSPLITRGCTMLVDCSAITFLDSAGLSTLLRLAHWARSVDARFRLTALSPSARRVLQLAGVGHVFAGPHGDSSATSAR